MSYYDYGFRGIVRISKSIATGLLNRGKPARSLSRNLWILLRITMYIDSGKSVRLDVWRYVRIIHLVFNR